MSKNAIITGGARGIGEAIARKLAANGINIIIWDVNAESAQATAAAIAKEYGVKAGGAAVDVTKSEMVDAAAAEVAKEYGSIDILVNNAGVTRDKLMVMMKDDDWDFVLNINLKGVFICTRTIARIMAKQRSGAIVNIASVVGLMGNVGQANYSASKGGVIALTKTTAREFAPRGVRCNAVAPGFIQTAMTDKLPEKIKEEFNKLIPLGHFGQPEDIAKTVNFLASEEASYITGQVICVDGGIVMS